MPMLTWLAPVLRAAGLSVREVPGWQTRGHGAMGTVAGVLAHHTAGPATGLLPSENVLINGRPGLSGPLCNLALDRAGTWVVVAAGQGYHAGTGSAPFCPAGQGNSRLIGVEAESAGTRDDWTAAQRESYPRGAAALLRHLGLPAARVIGHKEWAPGRKIDPAFWDMNAFRAAVARHLTTSSTPVIPPSPAEVSVSLTPTQDDRLRVLVEQMVTGPNPAGWGWDAWPGGSVKADGKPDRFTVVDFMRKQNQRAEDTMRALGSLGARVDALATGRPVPAAAGGPVALTDADVTRIAAAVVDLLSRRTAS